jgi:hypothetical protein
MMNKDGCYSKLCPVSLGVGLGVTEAIFMIVFAWAGLFFGYGIDMVHQISGVYIGYAPTIVGGLIGGGWGFVDGFIFGLIAGAIYNYCVCRCHGSCESK